MTSMASIPYLHSLVLLDGLLLGLGPPLLEALEVTAALEAHGGDKTLDLGGLGVRLGTLLLAGDLAANDELANVIVLGQVEEATDLGSTLGTKTRGEDGVGQSWDLGLSDLDNDDGENGNVGTDDATADRLALALTSAAGAVARVTVGEEETDTVVKEDTLLHGETC
jgi:hypothetical protein